MIDKEKIINFIKSEVRYINGMSLWNNYPVLEDRNMFLKYLLYRIETNFFHIKQTKDA